MEDFDFDLDDIDTKATPEELGYGDDDHKKLDPSDEENQDGDDGPDKDGDKPEGAGEGAKKDAVEADEAADEDDAEEDEGEEEGEPEAGAKKPGKKGATIPFDRFREVNEERKILREEKRAAEEREAALEARLAALEKPTKQEPEAPAYDFKAKALAAMTMLYDGDIEGAAALQEEIDAKKMEIYEAKALAKARAEFEAREAQKAAAQAAKEEAAELAATQKTANALVAKYPFLDSTSEDRDDDAIEMVLAMRDKLHSQGLSLHEALAQAAEKVAGKLANAQPAKAAPAPAKSERSKKALANAVDANNRIPPSPSTNGIGNRAAPDGMDPSKLGQLDWERLPKDKRDAFLRNL